MRQEAHFVLFTANLPVGRQGRGDRKGFTVYISIITD